MGLTTIAPATVLTGWTPTRVEQAGRDVLINWCWAEGARFTEPFWTESISRLMADPCRLLFQHRGDLADLRRHAETHDAAPPAGFIYHLSRCGSTLVGRALGSIPGTRILSEPAPLDQLMRAIVDRPIADQAAAARWMLAALSPARSEEHARVVVKLDAWHIHLFPVLRLAFPNVPWIFLGRDPLEVMVSHQRQHGAQMIPGALPRDLLQVPDGEHSLTEYGAHVLAAILRSAVAHAGDGGMLVDYRELPDAISERIASHFGMTHAAPSVELLAMDAKNPVLTFAPDQDMKRALADDVTRSVTDAMIRPAYAAFETALAAQRDSAGR